MTDTRWHASDALIERFAADPNAVDDARAASLEAHLVNCAHCRDTLNRMVDRGSVDRSWALLADQIDVPHLTRVERVMAWVGIPGHWARILASTPGLRASSLVAVVVALAGVVAASRSTGSTGPFLLVAPLFPLLVVSATFLPVSDPAGEAGVATPMHGTALALRRGGAVAIVVFVLLGAADVAIDDPAAPTAAWLLPALALVAASTALATWWTTAMAVTTVGGAWLTIVSLVRWADGRDTAFADSTTFASQGRWFAAALFLASVVVIVLRRERFETMEVYR